MATNFPFGAGSFVADSLCFTDTDHIANGTDSLGFIDPDTITNGTCFTDPDSITNGTDSSCNVTNEAGSSNSCFTDVTIGNVFVSSESDLSSPHNDLTAKATSVDIMDMSTSPSEDMNRTPSNMSISSDTCSIQGDSASSMNSDDGSSASTLCTTPTTETERDELDDWESIIDDTVSFLTAGYSKTSLSGDNTSFPQSNPETLNDNLSSECELSSSGDYEGGMSIGPCIFDDYCMNTNSHPYSDNLVTTASTLYSEDFGIGESRVATGEYFRTSTEDSSFIADQVQNFNVLNRCINGGLVRGENHGEDKDDDECGHVCAGKCEVSDSHAMMFMVDNKLKLKAADLNRIVKRLSWYV